MKNFGVSPTHIAYESQFESLSGTVFPCGTSCEYTNNLVPGTSLTGWNATGFTGSLEPGDSRTRHAGKRAQPATSYRDTLPMVPPAVTGNFG